MNGQPNGEMVTFDNLISERVVSPDDTRYANYVYFIIDGDSPDQLLGKKISMSPMGRLGQEYYIATFQKEYPRITTTTIQNGVTPDMRLIKTEDGLNPEVLPFHFRAPKFKRIPYEQYQENIKEEDADGAPNSQGLMSSAKNISSQAYAKGLQAFGTGSALFKKGLSAAKGLSLGSSKPQASTEVTGGRKRRTRAKRSAKSKRRNIKGGKKTRRGKSKRRR